MVTGRIRAWLSIALVAAMLSACGSDRSGALIETDSSDAEADYAYVIPDGTAERIAAGEPIAILPAALDVTVGEVIRIVNEDTEGHFVGIFYVGAGETVTQRFASPGEFVGNCTVHPSGQLTLTVHG
jgi:plastocyanin